MQWRQLRVSVLLEIQDHIFYHFLSYSISLFCYMYQIANRNTIIFSSDFIKMHSLNIIHNFIIGVIIGVKIGVQKRQQAYNLPPLRMRSLHYPFLSVWYLVEHANTDPLSLQGCCVQEWSLTLADCRPALYTV